MERRRIADRRKMHLFVAEERRTGPHDRRGAHKKRQAWQREREKVEKIKDYRTTPRRTAHSAPRRITNLQFFIVGLALILLVVLLIVFF